MRYTEYKENDLFSSVQFDNGEDDYTDVLNYLNQDFRTFGDGLLALAEKKEGKTIDNPSAYIKQKCKEAGIDVSRLGSEPTIRGWISETLRPKKGEDSRRRMFVLAFALGLSVDETKYLFQQVYLDRAFNQRNYREFIYYYCLHNHLSLNVAKELMDKVSFDPAKKADDTTVYTAYLEKEVAELRDTTEILNFIHSHAHNFSVDPRSAKIELLAYKEKALECAQEEANEYWDKNTYAHRDRKSDSFLYYVITGQDVTGGDKKIESDENGGGKKKSTYFAENGIRTNGTRTIQIKNATLPKEIKNNFPQVKSLSDKVDSSEEIRKTLIMLFSYDFWYRTKDSEIMIGDLYDDYKDQLNYLLARVGLPMMYFGNPYDWLFLYCTYQKEARNEEPLTVFREILTEVLNPTT